MRSLMTNSGYFKDKKVTVVGLARSGFASAMLLHQLGAKVSVTDKGDNDSLRQYAGSLRSAGQIEIELGGHSRGFIENRDLIVTSPGVDDDSLALTWADSLGIPVVSEIELAWMLCPAEVIAVTGTNGKTTVTTLIGKVIEAWGRKVHVCGNIGNPFSGQVSLMRPGDFVSLEVSSFQLERIIKFKPGISLILNFSRNHLDRYKDMRGYLEAKKRIFLNQGRGDYTVLNYRDPAVSSLARDTRAEVVYFNRSGDLNPNHSAVMAVAGILGIDNDICLDVLAGFRGVEHRLEYSGELTGVRFINDSKATTVDSAVWALNNISGPVILIAGGRDKGADFTVLREIAAKKVKGLILIGEAREKIRNALGDILPVREAASLEEALDIAWSLARQGDYVLLSPMCASFDMFADFEERGRVFKQAVIRLIEDKARGAAVFSRPPAREKG